MINLRIEQESVSWDSNGKTVSVNDAYLIKGAQYVASENLILVLSAERGLAEDLLAYGEDGLLKFSLRSPKGGFYYFTNSKDDIGVACGYDLNSCQVYNLDFKKIALVESKHITSHSRGTFNSWLVSLRSLF
jgi:hypothetical protein